jgi:MFS transporter, CP family, cyanate transporter
MSRRRPGAAGPGGARARPGVGRADAGQADAGQADAGQADAGQADAGRPGSGLGRRGTGLLLAGIVALAFNLRAAITSLPPVFPELAASLRLSSAALAVLAAVPVLCFGVFSVVAAPLSRRFGEERVLESALVLLAAGLLLRGALPGLMLLPGTALAAAAIALMNVLLPSLVKRRDPARAGLLIGIYLLSLSAGSILSSLIAVPVYKASGGSVPLVLGLWALPAIAAAVAWFPQRGYRTMPPGPGRRGAGFAAGGSWRGRAGRQRVYRHALAWQVTIFMGLQSLAFYATLSWLPTMFRDRGASAVHAGTLLALMNFGGALTALLIPVLAHRTPSQRGLIAGTIAATGAGLAGVWFAPLGQSAAWVFLLGLGQGAALSLAIYFTMARAPDPAAAASLSAFAQGTGYLVATTGPLAIGFLHTMTGGWTVPVVALIAVTGVEFVAGWQAARARTLPGPG